METAWELVTHIRFVVRVGRGKGRIVAWRWIHDSVASRLAYRSSSDYHSSVAHLWPIISDAIDMEIMKTTLDCLFSNAAKSYTMEDVFDEVATTLQRLLSLASEGSGSENFKLSSLDSSSSSSSSIPKRSKTLQPSLWNAVSLSQIIAMSPH